MEIRKVQKHGNSLAVNLPTAFAKNLQLLDGDYVELTLPVDKQILITKADLKHKEVGT